MASNHRRSHAGSLVDRGANGGIAGGDIRVINKTTKSVNIRGIDNHQITGVLSVTVKRMTNTILDRVGAPAYTWLLCLMYVCFILNVTVSTGSDFVPLQVATGSMADISPLLRFRFMEPVY